MDEIYIFHVYAKLAYKKNGHGCIWKFGRVWAWNFFGGGVIDGIIICHISTRIFPDYRVPKLGTLFCKKIKEI